MNANDFEAMMRTQAKALKKSIELYGAENYVDSDGLELWRQLDLWIERTKKIRRGA